MKRFTIKSNEYLKKDIEAYYSMDYLGYNKEGNPDYLNVLKNTYNSFSEGKIKHASNELQNVLMNALDGLLFFNAEFIVDKDIGDDFLAVCVVPRAKANMAINQMGFKRTVANVISILNDREDCDFEDGTEYIVRQTNTYTTHLGNKAPNYVNDGKRSYPWITVDTCHISPCVKDKYILLIDDIYTENVNIDEDAIQALLDNGAKDVFFYAVGKTKR